MNNKVKFILVFISFILFITTYGIIGSEESLDLFEKAIEEWAMGNSEKAYGYMKLAMEGEIYVTDLPEYWFMIAKLEIELGKVEQAKEALSNVLILNPKRSEVLDILNLMDTLKHGIPLENWIIRMNKFKEISGFVEGIEYFYTPVDVDMMGNDLFILDQANKRLVIVDGDVFKVMKLSGKPRSIICDPQLNRIYYSDVSNGNIYYIDMETGKSGILRGGFHYPVIFDIDRIGRILIGDMYNDAIYLLSHDGKISWKYILMKDEQLVVFNDAKIVFEKVYIQDITNRIYKILDLSKKDKIRMIKFPYDDALPLSFDVDGYEGIVTLWSNGKLSYMSRNGNTGEISSSTNFLNFSRLKYKPPFFIFIKPFNHSVVLYTIEREKSEYLNVISAIDVGIDEIKLDFTVNTLTGNCVHMVAPFLTVYDSGGRVGFDYRRNKIGTKIYETNDLRDFLESKLKSLNRNFKNYVLVTQKDGFSFDDLSFKDILKYLLSVKMKNVTFHVLKNKEVTLPKDLVDFVHMSSGMILDVSMYDSLKDYLENSKYCIEEVVYPMAFSMRSIKPVTVQFRVISHGYSDTIYYIGGLKLEKEKE